MSIVLKPVMGSAHGFSGGSIAVGCTEDWVENGFNVTTVHGEDTFVFRNRIALVRTFGQILLGLRPTVRIGNCLKGVIVRNPTWQSVGCKQV